VSNEAAEISTNNAMPGRSLSLVKLDDVSRGSIVVGLACTNCALDVLCDVLSYSVSPIVTEIQYFAN
jgi:hypothetical protein